MKAICIGCGCDEDHACTVPATMCVGGNGCWWLRFDADSDTGVCSACQDLLKAWDDGARAPILPLIAERFYRHAMFLYDEKASAVAWMAAPQALLSHRSPRELILAGDVQRVVRMLDLIRDGAYV